MYNFIRSVEVTEGSTTKFYFLTDEHYFSYHFFDMFGTANDIFRLMSHETIRKFFGLETKGVDRQDEPFWIKVGKGVPAEILEYTKDFEKHWGRIFRAVNGKMFTEEHYTHIVVYSDNEKLGRYFCLIWGNKIFHPAI
jgi:hypothetical protein